MLRANGEIDIIRIFPFMLSCRSIPNRFSATC